MISWFQSLGFQILNLYRYATFGSYVSMFDTHASVPQIGMKKLNSLVRPLYKSNSVDPQLESALAPVSTLDDTEM